MKFKLLALLLPLATLPGAIGADVSIALEIRLGKVPPPPPPEVQVIVVEKAAPPGPPPWAPARGFRRNHDYYYYPGADVYFRPADRVWFYLDGREWRFGVNLPASIHVDFDRSVALQMESDQPYRFHNEVRVYYPADYFVTRVRVKERTDKPGKGNSERGDDHSSGKSKGKGKNK